MTDIKLAISSVVTHTDSVLSHHMATINLRGGLKDLGQIVTQGQFIRPFN